MTGQAYPATDRTRLRRHPERGSYDRGVVHAILDEALVCHVGFVHDGHPFVIPTMHARVGDILYIHGAAPGRMLRTLANGGQICVTVTILDGLVLARSAFHHSMNFRSVLITGTAATVIDAETKLAAMEALIERMSPGRWAACRRPSPQELGATAIVAIPLEAVSAKVRTGPPLDDPSDLDHPVWAGVVPLRLTWGDAVADPGQGSGGPG